MLAVEGVGYRDPVFAEDDLATSKEPRRRKGGAEIVFCVVEFVFGHGMRCPLD
ncbi:hypothetical protein D3C87_2121190 [compost metagenome]